MFGEGSPGLPWEIKRALIDANNAAFDYTRAHSARTIFNVRFGLIESELLLHPVASTSISAKLGLPQYIADAALKINPNGETLPAVSVGGLHRDRGRRVHGHRPGNRRPSR